MGACLADALHYAHERGLLHLDLKPSNVLLAADGQPMLLDFHLARAPLLAGTPAPASLGGTPGYMAPEHQAALTAVLERRPLPQAVDGRADIYSLGRLLYGALGGEMAAPRQHPAGELSRQNPNVTPGLADLIVRCLAPEPGARYATAAELAADLRRHLADQPLRGVRNRSLVERWQKWRRRHPSSLALVGLLLAGLVVAGFFFSLLAQQARTAEAALHAGEEHLQHQRHQEALDSFHYGATLAEGVPLTGNLRRQLQEGMHRAEQGQAAGELHTFCERLRPLYGEEYLPEGPALAVADQCRELWQKRTQIVDQLGSSASPEKAEELRDDLLDLAILSANLGVRLAAATETHAAPTEALAVLAEAEAPFGPSCVLYQERRIHAGALGLADVAEMAAQQGAALAPRNAWEHYALGRAYLRAGDLATAAGEFDQALRLQPRALWPHFYRGICFFQLGQHEDALLAFTTCTVLDAGQASCFYNRGRVFAEMGRLDRALQDYDQALQLDPTLAAAALSRAELNRRRQHFGEALADLELARDRGIPGAIVAYHQALVHLDRQDRTAALTCLRNALRLDPGQKPARALLSTLQSSH
jgi:tetratricopeptide (TPR) repeat protein